MLRAIGLLVFFGAAVLVGVLAGTYVSLGKMLPDNIDIHNIQRETDEKTKIYSSDDVLLAEIFEENREFVPIEQIPQQLQDAVVAIEDKYFYKHSGVNMRSISRAVYENFREGRMAQGGSTITQQLARNIWLTRKKTLSRKLQEAILAVQIEHNYTKEQILELYLNEIYFGSGASGVKTAAEIYFGKKLKDLTLAESALLAGLAQRPSEYTPYENPDLARRRRNVVLNEMARQGYITREEAEKAKSEPIKLTGKKPLGASRYKAPYFVTYVLKQLYDKYGEDLVLKGGLRVYTTLNYQMQHAAEQAVKSGVTGAPRSLKVGQGALLCIDPTNGYIRSMVGGTDFKQSQFNRCVQAKRQPGSSFKPIVYTAALDKGYGPEYRISDSPVVYSGSGKPWRPKNYDRRYHGRVSMRQAIARSINIPAIKMMDAVGIQEVIDYAHILGIRQELEPNLSLAIGSGSVTMLEMVTVYGVFANQGNRVEPIAIRRITDRKGSLLLENTPQVRQVISEQTAQTMDSMLRNVVEWGTGKMVGDVPGARGKTGTTQDHRDAWFIGYTPELVTAVWVGRDDYTPMGNVYGGNVCAPIWESFMRQALPTVARWSGKTLTIRPDRPEPEHQRPSRRYRRLRVPDIYRYHSPEDRGTQPAPTDGNEANTLNAPSENTTDNESTSETNASAPTPSVPATTPESPPESSN